MIDQVTAERIIKASLTIRRALHAVGRDGRACPICDTPLRSWNYGYSASCRRCPVMLHDAIGAIRYGVLCSRKAAVRRASAILGLDLDDQVVEEPDVSDRHGSREVSDLERDGRAWLAAVLVRPAREAEGLLGAMAASIRASLGARRGPSLRADSPASPTATPIDTRSP